MAVKYTKNKVGSLFTVRSIPIQIFSYTIAAYTANPSSGMDPAGASGGGPAGEPYNYYSPNGIVLPISRHMGTKAN